MNLYTPAVLRNLPPHSEFTDDKGVVWTKCWGFSDSWLDLIGSNSLSSQELYDRSPSQPATPLYVQGIKPNEPEKTFFTDPKTGGCKEVKLSQLAAIDPSSLWALGEVAGYGASKYTDTYNYLKGYPWSLNFNSVQRHLLLFWGGENLDPESGLPHLAHAAWQCLTLLSFMNHALGTDDRWVPPGREDV